MEKFKRSPQDPYYDLRFPQTTSDGFSLEQVKNQFVSYETDPDNEYSLTKQWRLGYICSLRDARLITDEVWRGLCSAINNEELS